MDCLNIKIKKTEVLIFNKSGRQIKESFYYKKELEETVSKYKYILTIFQSSGIFTFEKEELLINL